MTILYFSPMACSLASRIACEMAGVDVTYLSVDIKSHLLKENQANYFDISLKGKVPVLEREDGIRLSENSAVLQYIADLNPAVKLAPPPESFERFRLQEWLSFVGTEIHKSVLYQVFTDEVPAPVKEHAISTLPGKLAIIEAALSGKPYLLGDDFTVADAYLYWSLLLIQNIGTKLAAYKNIAAYNDRISALPAVQKAVQTEMKLYMAQKAAAE